MESNAISSADPVYASVMDFYHYEADLLDNARYDEWLNCLAEDAIYIMPVRMTMSKDVGNTLPETTGDVRSGYYDDTRQTLAMRLGNVAQRNAWGEVPGSRTRRFISNLRLRRVDDRHVEAVTNILFTSIREAELAPDIIVGERHDTIIVGAEGPLILKRAIYSDNGAIPARALTIPI